MPVRFPGEGENASAAEMILNRDGSNWLRENLVRSTFESGHNRRQMVLTPW